MPYSADQQSSIWQCSLTNFPGQPDSHFLLSKILQSIIFPRVTQSEPLALAETVYFVFVCAVCMPTFEILQHYLGACETERKSSHSRPDCSSS